MAFYENIKGLAVVIHGPPPIVPFPLDGHKDFVEMPGIPQSPLSFFTFTRLGRCKFLTPLADRFIRNGATTFRESFFNFAEAQTESMVEPHGVADNFRGETMTLIAGCWLFHAAQSAKPELN